MARVVKKVKKTKVNKQGKEVKVNNLPKILASVIGGVLAIGLVVGLIIFFQVTSVDEKYNKSRSMDYATLVDVILENDKDRSKYEKEMYILVFHSDYETYPDNVFSSAAESYVNRAINTDLKLNETYVSLGISTSDRIGFYTMDLMDSKNEDILNNERFGNIESGPFVLKVTDKECKVEKKGSELTSSYFKSAIFETLDVEYMKYQDK